jgi:hypothetical protein
MRVLVFDISTSTGWALLEGEMGAVPKILETGIVSNDLPVSSFGEFPYSYLFAAQRIAIQLHSVVFRSGPIPDRIVIEEINKPGRFGNRYSQKVLDFIHCLLLRYMNEHPASKEIPVVYVNTSDWRKVIGGNLTKADKAMNIKVRKLKKAGDKEALKALGVRGKVTKKHVAIRYVNTTFGLDLKMKDNDIADAICQGTAYFLGVKHCDGK